MKIILLLIGILMSWQSQASCRCNCDFSDRNICASSYDIEQPCDGICPSQGAGFAPMRTACPPVQVLNPLTGVTEWRVLCNN